MKFLDLLPYGVLLLVVVSMFIVSVSDEFLDRILGKKVDVDKGK